MRNFNGAVNDWCYFNRLLTDQRVANRITTAGFCHALLNIDGEYRWWKLRRKDYTLYMEGTTTKFIKQ